MDASHFRRFIVRPTLMRLGYHSPAAENLLVGTAAHESGGFRWIRQGVETPGDGDGKALGYFQMEPDTHDDCWRNWLRHRPPLATGIEALIAPAPLPRSRQLVTNLAYAAAMARVHYLRVPQPLPAADDIGGLARYWKAHWNTRVGAGTPERFVQDYRRYVG